MDAPFHAAIMCPRAVRRARPHGAQRDSTVPSRTGHLPDDPILVEALVRGDEAVYEALMDRHYAAMVRLALPYLHDRDLTDDVIQETWIAVVNGIQRFEGRSSLRSWIFGILLNRARSRAALERRYTDLEEDAVSNGPCTVSAAMATGRWTGSIARWGPRQDPEGWVLHRELVERIESAIARLPLQQRTVITLRDLEGWSAPEVCELLGISEGNQRVLLHRARMAVRKVLQPYLNVKGNGESE